MKYATVCSGIGAPECAWQSLGWQCQFAAEIEPFPSTVHAHHFPEVPNYGDITKFKEWPQHTIDVLVGGTPCQSFSVAGLRKGLADPRGNLMLTFLAIVGRYAPAWVVWENVPGVLSIDNGRAFGAFLGGLAQLGYGFAYRVLDAQFFGVAQRRRRVFVIGCAGGQWQRAAAVLFERESLCGNPAPSREAGKRIAPTLESRANAGGSGWGTDFLAGGGMTAHSLRADGFDASEDGTGRGVPLVTGPIAGCSNGGGANGPVRRLTPTECERLQGFPDGWTAIQYRGKPAADGPRYEALGNSMAVPVLRWIGQRIQMVTDLA